MKHATLFIILGITALFGSVSCKEGEARAEISEDAKPKQVSSELKTEAAKDPDLKTINVQVEKLSPTTLTEYVVANGVTKAIREVTYSAEIPGKIEYLSADLGDRIRRGQVLARIDFKTLKAQASQVEARYNLAKTTHGRLAALKGDEIVSQQSIDEAQSRMISDEAQLSIAEANLAKSVVRSSYGGIVSAKYVEKAEYVGPGTRIYDVIDYRTIIVEARLAETQVASITRGAKVAVDISALKEQFEGTVETIIPTADRDSKTFTSRIRIKNPDLKILVGMSATVRVAARTHNDVIVASQSSVIEESGRRSVFVAASGVAKKRKVQLGAIDGDRVVLASGVASGDELIVLGQRDLIDGQPIRIVK
ncbi:MAG: efflux RND transporter periplasmic adaptor subunit [Proteobacteria bacterium]|nr:efflux RND transporter periplasmic adaptor subunit [Pseudomonadota bacterium]